MIKNILSEIKKITDFLTTQKMLLDINYPLSTNNKVCWSSTTCLSDYFDSTNLYSLYKDFVRNREFTYLLNDGSLIQIYYEFEKDSIIKHRLFFLNFSVIEAIKANDMTYDENEPLIDQLEFLYEYQENEEIYFNTKLLNSLGFVRFDFDKENAINIKHPASHLTINQEGVRIPVHKPLTPYEFLEFILYHYKDLELQAIKKEIFFDQTITEDEKTMIHLKKENTGERL